MTSRGTLTGFKSKPGEAHEVQRGHEDLGQGKTQYQYILEDQQIESSPVEDFGILVDKLKKKKYRKYKMAVCICSPESQQYPGLHEKHMANRSRVRHFLGQEL